MVMENSRPSKLLYRHNVADATKTLNNESMFSLFNVNCDNCQISLGLGVRLENGKYLTLSSYNLGSMLVTSAA